ncbi:MAG: hypothetical protein VXW22_14460 [Pseudomonadota bacterium]|nr:hypothetical protein [Pseudomonadota bacterium]
MRLPVEFFLKAIGVVGGLYIGYQWAMIAGDSDSGGRRGGLISQYIMPFAPILLPLIVAVWGWFIAEFIGGALFRRHYEQEAEKIKLPEEVRKRLMLQAIDDAKYGTIERDAFMMRVIELGDLVYQYRAEALDEAGATGSWEALEAVKGGSWIDDMFEKWIADGTIERYED